MYGDIWEWIGKLLLSFIPAFVAFLYWFWANVYKNVKALDSDIKELDRKLNEQDKLLREIKILLTQINRGKL